MRTLTILAVAIAIGTTVVLAQGRGEPADGSMAALIAEVRELRLAVQELSRAQSQTQALGVYLSAQQSRVLQVSSQLDVARKDLDGAALRTSELAAKLADLEAELREHTATSAQEQQTRARELELSQSLQAEESRWSALIARLEALTQR